MKQPPRLDTTRKRIARGIKIRDAGALNHLHTELPRLRGRTTLAIVQFYNRVMPRSERANEQAGKQCDRQIRRTATRRVIARKISQGMRCRVIANFCERLRAVPLESRRKKEKDRTARKTRDMSSVHNPILYLRLLWVRLQILLWFLCWLHKVFEDKRKTILNTRTNFRSVIFFFFFSKVGRENNDDYFSIELI